MEQWNHLAMSVSLSPQPQIALTPSQRIDDLDLQTVNQSNVLAVLDALGEHGWQLVGVNRDGDTGPVTYTGTYWLKRPRPDQKPTKPSWEL